MSDKINKKSEYLRIGKASDLKGRDYRIYRVLEMLPGFLSLGTLLALLILSYFAPIFTAYFIVVFNVYWLLLVVYMAIFLITAYILLKKGLKTDWQKKCDNLKNNIELEKVAPNSLARQNLHWNDVWHLVVLPTYNENVDIIRTALKGIINDGFPVKQMIVALAIEERAGEPAKDRARIIQSEFSDQFAYFQIVFHPDGIEGEIKGKGSNQAWCVKQVKKDIIDAHQIDYKKILVSVFDIDTIVRPGYFFALTYKFLSTHDPYRASYQPVPVYHNNVWQAPFFARVSSASNTFWQMIMQVREESLVTYSSHSMTFPALVDIGFWSPKNVSEDSRIFWHCLIHYNGDYRVEPIHFDVSMDITQDKDFSTTALSLYKQQRRWAWGAENIPYLIFNSYKNWRNPDFQKKKIIGHIFIQLYGFHTWATSALIIAILGWMPILLGGRHFNSTVLSSNLPNTTQNFMVFAMVGLFLSAIISSLLLSKRPKGYSVWKNILMLLEWFLVPVVIIVFGAIPCLDAQIKLMRGKYMGFWVTPKNR